MVNMPNVGSACQIQAANGVLMLNMKASVTSICIKSFQFQNDNFVM